jgi:hypothetical protein
MAINCTVGQSAETEFSDLTSCSRYELADLILKSGVATLAALVLIVKIIFGGIRWRTIWAKTPVNIVLIGWTAVQDTLMIIQNGLVAGLNIRSKTTLWLAFLTHISAASAAGIFILFVYIEVKIRSNSVMKAKSRQSFLLAHKFGILVFLGSFQALIFVIGPIISYFTKVPLYIMFWTPVVMIDFTLIPYFCFITYLLYMEISKMVRQDYKSLARQLLVTGVVCGAIGTFTGLVGLISAAATQKYEWVLLRLCWCSDIVFNLIFFVVLVRRPVRSSKVRSRSTSEPANVDSESSVPSADLI